MSNVNLNSLNDQTLVENTTGQITATALHGLIAAIIAAITAITLTQGVGVPHAATVANLKALALSAFQPGSVVSLDGYYKPGDMPETAFVLNASACSTNSGLGDGGSCYPASAATNSWQLTAQYSLDPRVWGVFPGCVDPYGTNAAQMNALLAYAKTLSGNSGNVDVDGRGLCYAVSDMIGISSINGLIFHNFTLQPTANWNVGVPSTKGILGILTGSSAITLRDDFFDMQAMPAWAIIDTQPGLVSIENVSYRHWGGGNSSYGNYGTSLGPTLDGGGIHFTSAVGSNSGATVDMKRVTGQQFTGQDAQYGDLTLRAGYPMWWDGKSGGSFGDTVQLQGGLEVMRLEPTSIGGLKFTNSYFLLGCNGQTGCTDAAHLGQPQQDPVCVDIANGASDVQFYSTTFSQCKLNYFTDGTSPNTPFLTIGAGMRYIYSAGAARFSSNFGNPNGNFINVITSGAGTNYAHVQIGEATDYSVASTTPAIVALAVTGTGSWARPPCGNSGGSTLNTNILTKIANQNSILALGANCTSLAGSTLGDYYGIGANVSTNDSADKYCGESVYFNNYAAITFTLPPDTPATCEISMVQASSTAFPVTLSAALGASLNGVASVSGTTPTKTLTRFQPGILKNWRNQNGASAEWFTYAGL